MAFQHVYSWERDQDGEPAVHLRVRVRVLWRRGQERLVISGNLWSKDDRRKDDEGGRGASAGNDGAWDNQFSPLPPHLPRHVNYKSSFDW